MLLPELTFAPSPDIACLLNALLDRHERRMVGAPTPLAQLRPVRSHKITLSELALPGYFSQTDPEPRQMANEQLQRLEQAGLLRLYWQPGEQGHLIEAVALISANEAPLYTLLGRVPTSNLRTRLESQLLGDRFRFGNLDWRYRAIQHVLAQIKENKSPSPFLLTDQSFNEDLLLVLNALSQVNEETPYRVFSVRALNDSKRFEDLRRAVIRLARQGHPDWKRLSEDELLRELNLVANPSYLLLSGPWTLVDANGQVMSLGEFSPSVGVPAVQATHLERVSAHASSILCVENLTTFHSLSASLPKDTALLCLAGNPSPACRHLLTCLVQSTPETVPLYVWADLDYGGYNILSQLRKQVSPRFMPYRMDAVTLQRFAQYARPLTLTDRRNLERQSHRPELRDVQTAIATLLTCGLKLEQEAITD